MAENSIEFAEFGSDFVTRRQGEIAREMLVEALAAYPEGERATVSLAGVGAITPSFADECFGKLLIAMGAARFRERISFVGADDTTRALLNAVLSKRARERTTSSGGPSL